MKIVLFKGKGIISRLIRWQTRSEYSHAGIAVGVRLIESIEGVGVRCRLLTTEDTENTEMFEVEGLTGKGMQDAWEFLKAQVGKKYDYLMVLRFLTREQEARKSTGKWFCSELVFAALQQAGIDLLRGTEPWEVSPGLLARSPRLKPLAARAALPEAGPNV